MKKKSFWPLLVLLVSILFIFFGCKQDDNRSAEEGKNSKAEAKTIKPIDAEKNDFIRAVGWLSNDTVLIQKQSAEKTRLIKYHLFSGKSDVLLETTDIISEIKISPDYQYFFIYGVSKENKVALTIYDSSSGEKIESHAMQPLAANFYWNPDSPEKLMVIVYEQNFSYSAYVYDFSKNDYKAVSLPSSLISWYGDNLYLANQKNSQSELGNLYLQNIHSESEKDLVAANIFEFATNRNLLLTIEEANSEDKVSYNFRSSGFESLSKYDMPREYDKLGTFIPYFDLNFSRKQFTSFEPYESREIGPVQGEYKLVQIDPETGKKQTILELVDNQPLLSSPNGNYLLYGYQYEKMIDLSKKEVDDFIEKEDDTY
ncbi:YqgU-like beta propeller domain-containing protein [Listeria kieliensis]|uniref:YqgU-like 6-bladed beta-propeller domain-containing protein n=1 Tax=Listeria kieliensis TaxID=1621700 RepID=A0A3D8TV96_9LIST|nr:hypothetical protein [Listeria kieliensis]RDX02913.1 hypothetical protein UR08_05295 [Listeria kieliensis]